MWDVVRKVSLRKTAISKDLLTPGGSGSESEKGSNENDQRINGKTSKKIFVFAICFRSV